MTSCPGASVQNSVLCYTSVPLRLDTSVPLRPITDLLFWWVDTPNGMSAAEVDRLFGRLIAAGLGSLPH